MKYAYIFVIGILASCGQSAHEQKMDPQTPISDDSIKVVDNEQPTSAPTTVPVSTDEPVNEKQSLEEEFKNVTLYQLTDTIHADFNGDGQQDTATFKKEKGTSGIVIHHGKTNIEVKIGFGEPFAHLTEFDWVGFWGLVKDSSTYKILVHNDEIVGDTIVPLQNPSIVVREEQGSGGLITFKDGKYEWVHQAH